MFNNNTAVHKNMNIEVTFPTGKTEIYQSMQDVADTLSVSKQMVYLVLSENPKNRYYKSVKGCFLKWVNK